MGRGGFPGAKMAASAGSPGVLKRKEYQESVLETMIQDVRYGGGRLRRNPGVTAVMVLILALEHKAPAPPMEALRWD